MLIVKLTVKNLVVFALVNFDVLACTLVNLQLAVKPGARKSNVQYRFPSLFAEVTLLKSLKPKIPKLAF